MDGPFEVVDFVLRHPKQFRNCLGNSVRICCYCAVCDTVGSWLGWCVRSWSWSWRCDKIVAFADSDWAGDVDDRKSTSGYLVKIGGTPIIWGSKKQTSVARSSFAAESVALTNAIDEIQWLCAFLKNLGYKPTYVPVAVDNQSLIATMNGNKSPTRLKHIDLRFHWLKEQMEKGDFKIEYCPTDKTTADIFTKALGSILFTRHRDNLSMVSLNQPLPP